MATDPSADWPVVPNYPGAPKSTRADGLVPLPGWEQGPPGGDPGLTPQLGPPTDPYMTGPPASTPQLGPATDPYMGTGPYVPQLGAPTDPYMGGQASAAMTTQAAQRRYALLQQLGGLG